MRVTNKMLSNTFMRDMNVNLENLKTLQSQMTSGKEINKPSDNPFKTARSMQITTDINANKQFGENITDTTNWLDTTDTALGQTGDILQRVRELMISAGNAAYGSDEKTAIKQEINQKIGELSQVLNTNYDGKYIFGGTRGTAKPMRDYVSEDTGNTVLEYANRIGTESLTVDDDNDEIAMINAKMSTEISQGVSMEYNVTAGEILDFIDKNGESKSLSALLTKITNHLDGKSEDGLEDDLENATESIANDDLSDITDAVTNLLKVRAEVGAKANRMESAKTKNEEENFNMTEVLSKTEDIDITQKTMEYATMQTVYNASLQTSARILQPTLMDYLR